MKRYNICIPAILLVLLVAVACKKSDSNNSARTVANLSGTYKLTALTGEYLSISINIYDSLPACEKDNLIKLNTDLTAVFTDAGTKCNPPEDSTGVWALSGDSLYVGDIAGKIKSFDGKTLVLTGDLEVEPAITVAATSTFVKQ
jgi:hypothetical protein